MRGASSPRDYLSSLELFGIKLGLSSIRAICEALGHPERAYPVIHVAGTNGKGSVAAMTAAALQAAGLRTGRYTSPHLVHIEERFAIDGMPVDAATLDAAIDRVRDAVGRLQASGRLDVHPTFFEVTTAVAFELFRDAHVDCAVVEVGLGGQFDATNVVQPVVTAIVSIARDHEQHLGGSLAAIAEQKAGIAKPGVPLVLGALPAEAYAAIARIASDRGAPIVHAFQGVTVERERRDGRLVLSLTTPTARYGPLTLALRGDHQADNAVVAVRVLEEAASRGLPVTPAAIVAGLERARWPARLQLIEVPGCGRVLLDGAHNPAGAEALARYVAAEWPEGLPIVFGAMGDKDIAGMLAWLRPAARPLIVTRAPGTRAAAPEDLAAAARTLGIDVIVIDDPADALDAAWSYSGTIVAAGSLFLAGRVLELLGPPGP